MALNLGYGLTGCHYAILVAYLRKSPELAEDKDLLFMAAIKYSPGHFLVGAIGVGLFALWRCSRLTQAFR